jgi:hypothetical protein
MTPPQESPPTQEGPQVSPPSARSIQSPSGMLCVKCRYLLDGLGERGICPECGEPFQYIRPCELVEVIGEQACNTLSRAATHILWGLALTTVLAPLILLIGFSISALFAMTVRYQDVDYPVSNIFYVLALASIISGLLVTTQGQVRSLTIPLPTHMVNAAELMRVTAIALAVIRDLLCVVSISASFYLVLTIHMTDLSCIFVLAAFLFSLSHFCFCHAWEQVARSATNTPLKSTMRSAKYGILIGSLGMCVTMGLSVLLAFISLAMAVVSLRRAANAPRPAPATTDTVAHASTR